MSRLPGVYKLFEEKWNGQTIWIISDTHFGDKDLRAGVPGRPSDEELVKLINSKVGRKDVLIHLGDVGDTDFIRQLRGYKVLIMGNHDAGRTKYERICHTTKFDKTTYSKEKAISEMKYFYPNCELFIDEGHDVSHAPFEYWQITADNKLFDEVYEGPLMIGEKLILSHEPVDIPWAYDIHGHDHAGSLRIGHTNVCADVIGYTPLNLNSWLKEGHTSRIQTVHRDTIDTATRRAMKRGSKKKF